MDTGVEVSGGYVCYVWTAGLTVEVEGGDKTRGLDTSVENKLEVEPTECPWSLSYTSSALKTKRGY